jgi:hypothetical protein
MLHTFTPFLEIGSEMGRLLERATLLGQIKEEVTTHDAKRFQVVVENLQRECIKFGFRHTAKQAIGVMERFPPATNGILVEQITALNTAVRHELGEEGLVRVPYDRVGYYEQVDAFGPEVAAAFPKCQRDIERAGSCYALDQPDACVHHLMLVLERGLNVLAGKLGVVFQYTNWEEIIKKINIALGPLPRGPQRQFYLDVNADFGFLKVAYRNHAEHVRDDPYDMPKGRSIYDHVRDFMRHLADGGLTE